MSGSYICLQFSRICALFCLHLEGGIIQQPSGVVSFREIGTKHTLSVNHLILFLMKEV